jgi:hypothetical protein
VTVGWIGNPTTSRCNVRGCTKYGDPKCRAGSDAGRYFPTSDLYYTRCPGGGHRRQLNSVDDNISMTANASMATNNTTAKV